MYMSEDGADLPRSPSKPKHSFDDIMDPNLQQQHELSDDELLAKLDEEPLDLDDPLIAPSS
jgi:hypothetical protein